ncbi:hypothetical protein ABZY31_08665 [Streptomyces sp. NPDC006529]|uniref:hypothetical protein n=1 Tax=Streptomyces sp. NPDC006529 TaxID=3157177 RepID=UPI0033AECFAC
MALTKSVQGRAFRLIHALLTATQKLGYVSAFGTAESAPAPHRRRNGSPHFTITAQGQRCDFLILQEQDRTDHIPTKKELSDAEKHSWVRIPRYDYSPAERLRMCISGGSRHRADEWADTVARPLEHQLAEIVQEVELRGEAAERKRLADLEAAREKRLRWEAAMEQAKIDYAETVRVQRLEAQERHGVAQRPWPRTSTPSASTQRTCRLVRRGTEPRHGSLGPRATCSGWTHSTGRSACRTFPNLAPTISSRSCTDGTPTGPASRSKAH